MVRGESAGIGQAAERAAVAAASEVEAAPGRLRMPARASRSSAAIVRFELGQGVADDPGAVAVVGLDGAAPSRLAERSLSRRGRRPPASGSAHDEGLLDVGLGVADQLAEELERRGAATSGVRPRRRSTYGIVAIVEPTRRRSQRHGREHELLELGPAIRLGGDALAVRMGERVDRDPVAGLASGTAKELPGPLGLAVQRPFEQIEGEPARLELGPRGTAGRR